MVNPVQPALILVTLVSNSVPGHDMFGVAALQRNQIKTRLDAAAVHHVPFTVTQGQSRTDLQLFHIRCIGHLEILGRYSN